MEYQEITKENIKEVLIYNGYGNVKVENNNISVKSVCSISLRTDNWLAILETALGKKLEPLPVHKFKVGDYIQSNGEYQNGRDFIYTKKGIKCEIKKIYNEGDYEVEIKKIYDEGDCEVEIKTGKNIGKTYIINSQEVEFFEPWEEPKANPFDVVKVGQWFKSLVDSPDDNLTKGKWYQRITEHVIYDSTEFKYLNDNGKVAFSYRSTTWDLTDIRDYDPNEYELKIGDDVEVDNYGNTVYIVKFDYVNEEVVYRFGGSTLGQSFYFMNTIKSVNGRKYDKITVPKFDFKQYLLDNEWQQSHNPVCFRDKSRAILIVINEDKFKHYDVNNVYYLCSQANADILIKAVKLLEELK